MEKDFTGWSESAKAKYQGYVEELKALDAELNDALAMVCHSWGDSVEKQMKIKRIENLQEQARYLMERI